MVCHQILTSQTEWTILSIGQPNRVTYAFYLIHCIILSIRLEIVIARVVASSRVKNFPITKLEGKMKSMLAAMVRELR